MNRYCVALLPIKNSDAFIALSQQISLEKDYKLGINSIPHVTIAQFWFEENKLEKLWETVIERIQVTTVNLTFKKFSCLTFDNNNYWISLLPTKIKELHELQHQLNSIIHINSLRPYDPHLTLLSTKDTNYIEKAQPILNKDIFISDDFVIAIGNCDELGQFTNIFSSLSPTE
ncbi:2'-5' RNA ligase family protein [Legionella lytica]|uniref:2'-5' RNA ligase family protein n=1 Tax=Legionella lytica TaxID=96232 RepID=A0ABW8D334_9GAMM